ncbi:hypothetical protein WJX72_002019 [[Myrmecia] bisecta]|uniref:Ribonuclease M5 C-terminal domain-containing protein n=1 Tax=[Myrmecia] bisecta TaxID=41462 RepID=A0AAW1P6X3_9CHLO
MPGNSGQSARLARAGMQQRGGSAPRGRPCTPFLIVVEGGHDRDAVQAAVDARVFVLGGAVSAKGWEAASKTRIIRDLRAAAAQSPGLVVLLDPDHAGRQGRDYLDREFPGCLHAFLPLHHASLDDLSRQHSIGVEHAQPAAILAALSRARASQPGRAEFSQDELRGLGLVADWQAMQKGVRMLRMRVCAYLGIGAADGKQLLRALNSYGFSREELLEAIAAAQGPGWPSY